MSEREKQRIKTRRTRPEVGDVVERVSQRFRLGFADRSRLREFALAHRSFTTYSMGGDTVVESWLDVF